PWRRSWPEPPSTQSLPPSPKMASAPEPAIRKSSPSPANVSLSLLPPLMKSFPSPLVRCAHRGPPSSASSPAPPSRMSAPSRSVMMSSSVPPKVTSSPPPPSRMSLPPAPQRVSLSLPPNTRSMTASAPWNTDWPLIPGGWTLLRRRYWNVPSGLRRRSWFSSQSDEATSFTEPAPLSTGLPSALTVLAPLNGNVMSDSLNLQSEVPKASDLNESVRS